MKKILGLDLGTASIGWALVNEAENKDEKSSIIKLGVRVNPLTVDELTNFEQGKAITTNADRALKHGMRLNLYRYKLRREHLIKILKENHFIGNDTILSEDGNFTTFETYRLRAKAATEEITLEQFARVLLMLNKKRGYKSNRKAKTGEDGKLIDGMSVARELYDNDMTPGQYGFEMLNNGKHNIPDFYRSDLEAEFNKIWDCQAKYYPEILTLDFKEQIKDKSKTKVNQIFYAKYQIHTADNSGKEKKLMSYKWRKDAISQQLDIETMAYVIADLCGQISGSSGLLGAISDRSKNLYFNHLTVGQDKMAMLEKDPNCSLKNQTYYRQDYLDEFETIWETQARFYKELTPELKHEIRDIVIFYQRRLKSKKSLIAYCQFESHQEKKMVDGKQKTVTIGLKVCPKSSPLFQEFKTWQVLNNLVLVNTETGEEVKLSIEQKNLLAEELKIKASLSKGDALKLLFKSKAKEYDMNFKILEGNRTMDQLFKTYASIIEANEDKEINLTKMSEAEIIDVIGRFFKQYGIDTGLLTFDSSLEGQAFENQPVYKLWHLLYSYEDDNSKTGNEKLLEHLHDLFGFKRNDALQMAGLTFEDDYGELSSKAMKKILSFMKEGQRYDEACASAGYNHSSSMTKEQIDNKQLVSHLDLLPKNSLRNPVVEKILNQMINVINAIVEEYGKPDEIRLELARELKKSAKERQEMTENISEATRQQSEIFKLLQNEFGIQNPSRNDIIRYRLYEELKANGYHTLYSNRYISKEQLFSKEIDIEHIIPQAKLFDDSFSNKTIEYKEINILKADSTAYDFVRSKYGESEAEAYKERVESLAHDGKISRTKRTHLLMTEAEIPDGFIERDLRNSQYIAKKAQEILGSMVKFVVPTTGSITDVLREDWQLVDVMQELNWDKYDKLGMTRTFRNRDGHEVRRIEDWTKRNDHRHHAMDALTIAFTKRSIVQYLNYLSARKDQDNKFHQVILDIEKKELHRDDDHHLVFNPPMDNIREEAKKQLQNILVSIKSKSKVMTENVNVSKSSNGTRRVVQQTPRGQLHNETVYGLRKRYLVKEEKVGAAFDVKKIDTVSIKRYRAALLNRLMEFDGDAKKAFTGKNSLEKNPIYVDSTHTESVPLKVRTVDFEEIYTIRKPITRDLKIDKVIDTHIREILIARLKEYDDDANKAFSNLDENPIWLNREKGIAIKRVTITGVSNAVALHDKLDKEGNAILDVNGNKLPSDFVSTSNNHHSELFIDADGNVQEHVVSFMEAVEAARQHQPVVNRHYNEVLGWKFLFSMKQNDYFVFPRKEKFIDENGEEKERVAFDPKEIDLMDPKNYAIISSNLYRVQKFTFKDYFFRHHLETTVDDNRQLHSITWIRKNSLDFMNSIVKVRVNHIGQIVSVGE
jgi:CRISPR-associated endonuclease Csn1